MSVYILCISLFCVYFCIMCQSIYCVYVYLVSIYILCICISCVYLYLVSIYILCLSINCVYFCIVCLCISCVYLYLVSIYVLCLSTCIFNVYIYFVLYTVSRTGSIAIVPNINNNPMIGEDLEFMCQTSGRYPSRNPVWRYPDHSVIRSVDKGINANILLKN